MNPKAVNVTAQNDFTLLLTFANKERRLFDVKPYLDKGVFKELQNLSYFKTAKIVSGSVEWINGQDLSYDSLYLKGKTFFRKLQPTQLIDKSWSYKMIKEYILKVLFIFILCFSYSNLVIANTSDAMQQSISEEKLISFLLNEQFDELNKHLQIFQQPAVEAENHLHKAFYIFYRANPKVGSALDKWVAQQPKSEFSHLARGIFRIKMGWASRGTRWASQTTQSQFSGMESWFQGAKEELNYAITINPKLVEAYCYLIEIGMNEGGGNTKTLYSQALKANPSSFIAREFYLHSLLPRWGGNYEEMKKVIAEMKPYYKDNPQLKVLEGRIAADLGELASFNKENQSAIKLYKIALTNGDFWFYNQNLGKSLYEADDYQGAIEQFSKVIKDKPGYKDAFWMRAQSYKMQEKFKEALADINYVINIEPNDDSAIAARGYIFQMSGDLKSALIDFQTALKVNPTQTQYQEAVKDTLNMINKKSK